MSILFEAVLSRVMNQKASPKNFLKELGNALYAESFLGTKNDFLIGMIQNILHGGPDNPVKKIFQIWLIQSDGIRQADWAEGTESNTQERRNLIYELLELQPREIQIVQEKIPASTRGNPIIAVENEHWYTEARKNDSHYGNSLLKFLRNRGWTPQNIGLIDAASNDIIGNLADPEWALDPARQNQAFACRGLVVGYVQSGKTTTINLTTAKAIDAGYRLIVILSGTTNLLRKQTQRRVDKEVVGKHFLQKDLDFDTPDGYSGAPDWGSFIEHPEPIPGKSVRDIDRLTTLKYDFSSAQGANALSDSWVNSESSTKIAVVKKHKSRLINLNREFKKLGKAERECLSVLIIDDESDQASLNTNDPKKSLSLSEEKKRTAINHEIVSMLRLLPRAQYVGVTATPVANCFVDPKDANDLYPRNFILPLVRPEGYMGILDFHDLDDELEPITDERLQLKRQQHIRAISHPVGSDEFELTAALDAWVIAGGLKLYRNEHGIETGRHHTFFYSDSTGKEAHKNARDRLGELWPRLGFNSASGWTRLKNCYENEMRSLSEHKSNLHYFPTSFDQLIPFVVKAIQKIDTIYDGNGVVLVVNSADYSADIDFDRQDIWKVVVGGQKLSRGYTIEGLTVTYFRRTSADQSALMQMGRWFGYRAGYRDLVRLWISRNEPAKPNPIDIYDRYQTVCIDEENLRRKFAEWYGTVLPDGSKINPLMIRPLIELSDVSLLPVAKNKMWNTVLEKKGFQDIHSNVSMSAKRRDLEHNERLFKNLFSKYSLKDGRFDDRKMFYTVVPHSDITELICDFARPNLKDGSDEVYFRHFLKSKDCRVNDWLVFLPQLLNRNNFKEWQPCPGIRSVVVKRKWRDEDSGKLTTIGDKPPRIAARVVSKTSQDKNVTAADLEKVSTLIRALAEAENRAVLVLTPSYLEEPGEGTPFLGYECFLPRNSLGLAFRTKYKTELPIVDKTED